MEDVLKNLESIKQHVHGIKQQIHGFGPRKKMYKPHIEACLISHINYRTIYAKFVIKDLVC